MEYLNLMSSLSLSDPPNPEETILKPASVKIDDVDTEIVYGVYTDRTILIVSQYGKLGSMYSIVKEDVGADGCRLVDPVYTVKSIFGVDDILQQAAARFLAEQIDIQHPLYLFICLKDYGPSVLKAIVEIVNQLKA